MDEYELEYLYEIFEKNYNIIPYSFITFGEFSVENAKSITHEEHQFIFDSLLNEDIIKYGSLTISNENEPDMYIGKVGTAGIFNDLTESDNDVKRVCYNKYPLGIISRITEKEFKIEIID